MKSAQKVSVRFSRRRRNPGMSLIELAVAMAVLSIIGWLSVEVAINMERSQMLTETHLSAAQELSRQTQMLRVMPLRDLLALPSTANRTGELNGIFCPTNVTPTVVWQRLAVETLPATGESVQRFWVVVSVNRLGVPIALSNMVVRSQDRETRLVAP